MKRMIDRNKILNTKVGDDIHFYINGEEGRGIVVKMNNDYVMVAKEDGDFQDIHINDTFFVKDILINKTWDLMEDEDRYEALIKIHAPSPRFISKPWADLPQEIKKLLTEDKSYEGRGDIDPDVDVDADRSGSIDTDEESETHGEYKNPKRRAANYNKVPKGGFKHNKPSVKNNGAEESHKKEDDMDSDWRGEKETREKADPETEALDHEQQNLEEQNESNESAKEDWARAEDGQTARKSEDFKKLKPVYEGNKEEKKSFYEEWLEEKSEQFRKIYGGKKKQIKKSEDFKKLKPVYELIITHLVRRKIDTLCLKENTREKASGNKVRQVFSLIEGIEQLISKKITSDIKNSKLKVQVRINGNELRINGKKKDDLQSIIQMIKEAKLGIPVQFVNYRD